MNYQSEEHYNEAMSAQAEAEYDYMMEQSELINQEVDILRFEIIEIEKRIAQLLIKLP